MHGTTRRALLALTAYWLALLPAFAAWLWLDRLFAPWDQALHSAMVMRFHEGLARGNPWRFYELGRFYPPLFHALALPASVVTDHPDAFAAGNWLALLALLWGTYLTGARLAGHAAGLAAAFVVSAYGQVAWQGRMAMTDLTLTATVAWTLCLLVRPIRLAEPRDARRLGIAIGLGMLAKWAYVLFLWLPLLDLVRRHRRWAVGAAPAERRRRFWLPLARVAGWAAAIAGPWYVRSLPSLVGRMGWHLGGGVMAAEGDPSPWSLASLAYYPRWLDREYFTPPTLLLLAVGAVVVARAWRGRAAEEAEADAEEEEEEIAPPSRWAPLLLSLAGGSLLLVAIANKDGRYPMPLMPALAVVSGAAVAPLHGRVRRGAVAACAALSYALVLHALFVLAPPDGRDWKVVETAEWIAPRLPPGGRPARVLVVPNEPEMNAGSIGYALARALGHERKVEVDRVEAPLDEAALAGYAHIVVVTPPPLETLVSRHSAAAADLVLANPGWIPEARFERGDGRIIRVLAPRAGTGAGPAPQAGRHGTD